MSILIFALLVLLVLALVIYAIDLVPLGDGRIKGLIKVIAAIIAALVIVQRAGLI